MTHKYLASNYVLRSIPLFVRTFAVLIALAALGQKVPPTNDRWLLLKNDTESASRVSRAQISGLGVSPTGSDPLFLPPVNYDTGAVAFSIAVGDVNGDGKQDVVVGNCGLVECSNNHAALVSVLLGNGDGTFQAPMSFNSCGDNFAVVALADLDNDGKLDLVVSHFDLTATICVYLGNGDGTFRNSTGVGISGLRNSNSLAIADLNGDGKADLAVAFESAPGGVGVALGNGDGTFQSMVYYPIENGIEFVTAADVNGDGKADLLVGDRAGLGAVWVLLGKGDGTFFPQVGYSSGGLVSAIAVADLNGDRKADLAVANQCVLKTCLEVGVLLGNGDGTFQTVRTYATAADTASSVAVADVNEDGRLDVVVAINNGTAGVLLGNGDGTLQPVLNYDAGGFDYRLAVADVNGDLRPDILMTSSGMHVLLNNTGPHSATATTLFSDAAPAAPGQLVTYTATVNSQYAGPVNGTMTFQDGSKTLGTIGLTGGVATFSLAYPNIGKHLITAAYSGDYYSAGSTSSILKEHIKVLPVGSVTHVTTSGSPSHLGQPVTFTATVTSTFGKVANGELVTFFDGRTAIGTGTTASGVATFTTSSLTAKKHTIKAVYSGDGTFASSHGIIVQVVEP